MPAPPLPDDLADRLDLTGPDAAARARVRDALYALATRLLGGPFLTRYCKWCGEPFLVFPGRRLPGVAKRPGARFCGAGCRQRWRRKRAGG